MWHDFLFLSLSRCFTGRERETRQEDDVKGEGGCSCWQWSESILLFSTRDTRQRHVLYLVTHSIANYNVYPPRQPPNYRSCPSHLLTSSSFLPIFFTFNSSFSLLSLDESFPPKLCVIFVLKPCHAPHYTKGLRIKEIHC